MRKAKMVFCGILFLFAFFGANLAYAGQRANLALEEMWLSPATTGEREKNISAKERDVVIVSMAVANTGRGNAEGTIGRVVLSRDGVFNSKDVVVDEFEIPPLLSGENTLVEASFSVPEGAKGTYRVLAWLDSKRGIREGNEGDNRSNNKKNTGRLLVGNYHNADSCGILWYWFLIGEISAEELGNGAQHDYSAAEILAITVKKENRYNPVIAIVFMEMFQKLISKGQHYGDFELRLRGATGYGIESELEYKWRGFAVQVVCAIWQAGWDRSNGMSFREFVEKYFGGREGAWEEFCSLYEKYTKQMNRIMGTNYNPTPSSDEEFFFDFTQEGVERLIKAFQRFFEKNKSPLADRLLFRKPEMKNSVVSYTADTCLYPPQ